ncbi:hypothetical protein FJTKL_08017 [Diaporthe vaccinii]|uniref:Uncharacterized protein n=1 Tax=Diaporthe vaccinii TaxID=105482 RepID=A0ABR4FE72_9PEZI
MRNPSPHHRHNCQQLTYTAASQQQHGHFHCSLPLSARTKKLQSLDPTQDGFLLHHENHQHRLQQRLPAQQQLQPGHQARHLQDGPGRPKP